MGSHPKSKIGVPVPPQNGFKTHGQSHLKFRTQASVSPQNNFKTHNQSDPVIPRYLWPNTMALKPSHPKFRTEAPVIQQNAFKPHSQRHPKLKTEVPVAPKTEIRECYLPLLICSCNPSRNRIYSSCSVSCVFLDFSFC